MKVWFLPSVREGLVPERVSGGRTQVAVTLRLESAGRAPRDVSRVMSMPGPGDVLAIEPRQVLRVTPSAGTRNAEVEFFPAIEFDAPDLPWAYSPALPDGRRTLPWIALVVLEAAPGITITPGAQGQSPWILRLPASAAERELPDLSDAWAWAHAQVTCDTPDAVAATLAAHPDRTLSRLLAPRRLYPFRAYHACVVPTFLTGRIAGLGADPTAHPGVVTGTEPAWSGSDRPAELPVYYTWSFRTGEAGDFESLARGLRAAPLDTSVAPTALHLSLPDRQSPVAVDWEPPLRIPGASPSRPRHPAEALDAIRRAIEPQNTGRPVLGPAYFGAPWSDARATEPLTRWMPELNMTPAFRAAAGLGAEAVRGEQDALMAAAAEQFEQFRARQREGRRQQLAASLVNRVAIRLARAPQPESARVLAPLVAKTQGDASNAGLLTTAGRRAVRKAWTAPLRTPIPSPPGGGLAPVLDAPVRYRRAVERRPAVPPPIAPPDPRTIPTAEFTPRFARPTGQILADRFPELMLPGSGPLPPDGVLVVESNPAFVEAFLVGANQELTYELLWRGLSADRRGTAFRRFWNHVGDADDIPPIVSWAAGTGLGTHAFTHASLVLLIRSELVRRYPTLLVAAVPAVWEAGARAPHPDPATVQLPSFRGRVGDDVLYAGFSTPSIADAVGAPVRSGPAGWFFLLAENPGDPRFGLDPESPAASPTRATLAWNHLALAPGARYATHSAFPAVPDAGFTAANATAATLATLLRQRPFRAFLHASLLVRLDR